MTTPPDGPSMYTRCSHCHTAFRITVAQLRHAGGRVRCGACGETFSALESLEERVLPPPAADAAGPAAAEPAETPASEPGETAPAAPPPLEPESGRESRPDDEPRYDDDTGIDEVTWQALQAEHERASARDDAGASDGPPDVPDADESPDGDDIDDDLDDALAEEVAALMRTGEFEDDAEAPVLTVDAAYDDDVYAGAEPAPPLVSDDDDTQRHDWDAGTLAELESVYAEAIAASEQHTGPDDDLTPDAGAPRGDADDELPDTVPGTRDTSSGAHDAEPEPEPEPESEPERERAEAADTAPDAVEPRAAADVDDTGVPASDASMVQTVTAESATPEPFADPAPARRAHRWPWVTGSVVLVVMLAAQLIHYQRAELATHPVVGPRLAEMYDRLGIVLYPAWPLEDYALRAGGDVQVHGDNRLDLGAELRNDGNIPLALPLLRLTLLDRWGESLAQRVLVPADYAGARARQRLEPGDTLPARFSVRAPEDDVFGYRLAVCRRVDANRILCDDAR